MYWDLGSGWTVTLVYVMTLAQLFLHTCKCICDFRIQYQIVSPQRYGTMVFVASAVAGIVGVGFSWLFALMVDRNTGGNPYFFCMLVAAILLAVAAFFNSRLVPIYSQPKPRRTVIGLGEQWKILMEDRSFRCLLIPNLLRGITMSVTSCIVLFALVMDIDESGRAKIPMVCALATVLASVIYIALRKNLSMGILNIVGGILTCALVFLPRGNTQGFLLMLFVSHLGRTIVDNAVPIMLFPLVKPGIAGLYNPWRCVLYGICSLLVTPIISTLIECVPPLLLLVPGALTYLVVTAWYYIICRELQKS